MVYQEIDGPVYMDIDGLVDYGSYMGAEDYGRLVSFDVFSSRFWSSQYMTPTGNQTPLGICVSFVLTAALGALAGLTYGSDVQNAPEFSMQEMIDCIPIGPGGVSYQTAYDYVWRNGLHMENVYPYICRYFSRCRCPDLQSTKYSFGGYTCFDTPWFNEASARAFLYSHPLTALMPVYGSFELHATPYVSATDLMGVYSPLEGEVPSRDEEGDFVFHAILVIGYGIKDGKYFFIIKNSWGVNGYARVAEHLVFCFAWPNSFRAIPAPR